MPSRPRHASARKIVPTSGDVEARSTLAFCLLIGHHFMSADHGRWTRDEAVDLAARLLGTSPETAE